MTAGGAFTGILISAADAAAMPAARIPAAKIKPFDIACPQNLSKTTDCPRWANRSCEHSARNTSVQQGFRQYCRKLQPVMFLQRCGIWETCLEYQLFAGRLGPRDVVWMVYWDVCTVCCGS